MFTAHSPISQGSRSLASIIHPPAHLKEGEETERTAKKQNNLKYFFFFALYLRSIKFSDSLKKFFRKDIHIFTQAPSLLLSLQHF